MQTLKEAFKVKIQYFLPKKIISRLVGLLASAKMGKFTSFLIKIFIKYYKVDMSEALIEDIYAYKTFNEFFTRLLKPSARTIEKSAQSIVSPVDGRISEFGEIYKDAVIQAKGHYYSLNALLGGEEKDTTPYQSGDFITIYLSPANYHRVHMPMDGELERMIFIPGDLFSVNPLTAQNVDNLFARNERVVFFFNNKEFGRFALVMVGATIVASISTAFAGIIAPSSENKPHVYQYEKNQIKLKKGEELGHFLLGSTVICVFPKDKITFNKDTKTTSPIKMGKGFASIK